MFEPKFQSRLLNDRRFALGLSLQDFVLVLIVFLVVAKSLEETAFAAVSFIVAIGLGSALLILRSRHRDGILRDLLFDALLARIRRK